MRRNFRLGRVGLSMLMATAILVFPVLGPAGTHAQKPAGEAATGKVTGTVTDNKGAGISGVRVTITNVDTEAALDVTTDDSGNFEAAALPLGSYRVGADLYGFRKAVSTAHKLLANQTLKFDVRMETDGPSETVTVTSISPEPSRTSPEPSRLAIPGRAPTVAATSPQSPGAQIVVPTSPQSPGRQKDGSGNAQPDEQTQPQTSTNVVWTVEEEPPADPSYKANGGERAGSPSVPLVFGPIDRSWTTAGSAGTIDEDSLAIAAVQDFTTRLLPGQTGTVRVRYNVTAVDGTTSFCPATNSVIKFRYRNSDPTGVTAKFSWELHSTNVNSGGNILQTSFASTLNPMFNNGSSFLTVTGNASLDFDFTNNIYWFEVTILRTSAAAFSDIGSFQVFEQAGTPCP